ncbi:hypothetical protein JZ751_019042 [Albula glossodonta]|uniref:Uncharacterized protein n=1 Tax=Albula glossodonta TaxID=121402 RepID=A0A8T2NYR6_9TELE|nr:hypothetical protein JZ751_019042 [Albula glossodonta]
MSAACLRFSTKVASISMATVVRSTPTGTLPAIKWILQSHISLVNPSRTAKLLPLPETRRLQQRESAGQNPASP